MNRYQKALDNLIERWQEIPNEDYDELYNEDFETIQELLNITKALKQKDYRESYDILSECKCDERYNYLRLMALKDYSELIEIIEKINKKES